jgi:hypothetical protein
VYVISKGGDSLDMSGEKHGADAVHVEPAKADALPQPLLLHRLLTPAQPSKRTAASQGFGLWRSTQSHAAAWLFFWAAEMSRPAP